MKNRPFMPQFLYYFSAISIKYSTHFMSNYLPLSAPYLNAPP